MIRRGIVIDPPLRNTVGLVHRAHNARRILGARLPPSARTCKAITISCGHVDCRHVVSPILVSGMAHFAHQLFRALYVAIGDRADDLDRLMSGEVYLHDGTGPSRHARAAAGGRACKYQRAIANGEIVVFARDNHEAKLVSYSLPL